MLENAKMKKKKTIHFEELIIDILAQFFHFKMHVCDKTF